MITGGQLFLDCRTEMRASEVDENVMLKVPIFVCKAFVSYTCVNTLLF
jgi:hypothetical protein